MITSPDSTQQMLVREWGDWKSDKDSCVPSPDKLDYFIARTDEDLAAIKKQLEDLNSFKFKILGASAAVAFLVTIVVEVIKH